MKRPSKKIKILLTVVISVALLFAVALTLALNFHSLFVYAEKQGWFKTPVEIEATETQGLKEYTLEELCEDERVSIDQSLMLVNIQYMLPEGFVPDAKEYKDTDVYMNSAMLDAYRALSSAVQEKTGNKLYVSSDLRTAEEQEALYLDDPTTATLPGASEHQSGLALDVYVAYYAGDGFVKSPSGRFVNRYAHEYGFIIRYPSYGYESTGIRFEPWHIRYVGHPHASVIYNNHLTLEEYILSFEIGEWYKIDGYVISRQKATDTQTILLPENFNSCTISPDNTGHYIITVK